MKLLVLVLNKVEYLDTILTAFVEAGVTGATILESEGMGRALAYEVPLFAGLRKSLQVSDYNKTIFSVIHDDTILNDVVKLIEQIIDFDEPDSCLLFVVPLLMVKGIKEDELRW
ncbi:MAG: P-II family nitrogen regulator [bacterium]